MRKSMKAGVFSFVIISSLMTGITSASADNTVLSSLPIQASVTTSLITHTEPSEPDSMVDVGPTSATANITSEESRTAVQAANVVIVRDGVDRGTSQILRQSAPPDTQASVSRSFTFPSPPILSPVAAGELSASMRARFNESNICFTPQLAQTERRSALVNLHESTFQTTIGVLSDRTSVELVDVTDQETMGVRATSTTNDLGRFIIEERIALTQNMRTRLSAVSTGVPATSRVEFVPSSFTVTRGQGIVFGILDEKTPELLIPPSAPGELPVKLTLGSMTQEKEGVSVRARTFMFRAEFLSEGRTISAYTVGNQEVSASAPVGGVNCDTEVAR